MKPYRIINNMLSKKRMDSLFFLQKYKKWWMFCYTFYFHVRVCIVQEICKRLMEDGYIDAYYRRTAKGDAFICNHQKELKFIF